jgi:hypothetical protein
LFPCCVFSVHVSAPHSKILWTKAWYIRSILILSSHQRLGLLTCIYTSSLPIKLSYTFIILSMRAISIDWHIPSI